MEFFPVHPSKGARFVLFADADWWTSLDRGPVVEDEVDELNEAIAALVPEGWDVERATGSRLPGMYERRGASLWELDQIGPRYEEARGFARALGRSVLDARGQSILAARRILQAAKEPSD